MGRVLVLSLLGGVGSERRCNVLDLRRSARLFHSSSVILILRRTVVQIRCRFPVVLRITQPLSLLAFEPVEIILLYRRYFSYLLLVFAAFPIVTWRPIAWPIGDDLRKMLEDMSFVFWCLFKGFYLFVCLHYLFFMRLLILLNDGSEKSR
jgi:hypothetical protein